MARMEKQGEELNKEGRRGRREGGKIERRERDKGGRNNTLL